MQKTVHINWRLEFRGLSAAVRLANAISRCMSTEATQQAGGRCRSYFDAATNLTIDNGNHLLLRATATRLLMRDRSATEAGLVGPKARAISVRRSHHRAALAARSRRQPTAAVGVRRGPAGPRHGVLDYLALAPLIWAAQSKLVGDAIPCKGTLYQRLVQPLLLAALNVDPPEGSAGLAGAVVREDAAWQAARLAGR